MKYNPKTHNRKSIRLKGYDYSQPGFYFITICFQNKTHFYGEIRNNIMFLNDPGKMIQKWYYELENKFPDIQCHEMVIMPNHFHCIIQNIGNSHHSKNENKHVGIDQRVYPKNENKHVGIDQRVYPKNGNKQGKGEHVGSPLHRVVQWFKTMTTNEYIRGVKSKKWKRFDGKLWQKNYWEHIIRDNRSYENISQYIQNNPFNWQEDILK